MNSPPQRGQQRVYRMISSHCVFAILCIAISAAVQPPVPAERGQSESLDAAIELAKETPAAELVRARPAITREYLRSAGWMSTRQRALALQRFESTAPICAALDKICLKNDRIYAQALFYVLGVVKDPQSIVWLRKRLNDEDAGPCLDAWLDGWLFHYGGRSGVHPNVVARWLTEHDRWATFLTERIALEKTSKRRMRLLRAMARNLTIEATIERFRKLEAAEFLSDKERLFVQAHLYRYGQSIDEQLLAQAIKRLRCSTNVRWLPLLVSAELPHELFLPWIIEIHRDRPGPESTDVSADGLWSSSPLGRLREITLEPSIERADEWQAWYEKHRGETHRDWAGAVWSRSVAMVNREPANIDKVPFAWRRPLLVEDRDVIEQMKVWVTHECCHEVLARWICQLWTAENAAELRPIALHILSVSGERLPTYRWRLETLGVIDGPNSTWQAFVIRTCRGPS